MESVDLYHWLLLQALVLVVLICLVLALLLKMSRSRLFELQAEFRRLALEVAELSALDSVDFDALIIQTQTQLRSEGMLDSLDSIDLAQESVDKTLLSRLAWLQLEQALSKDLQEDGYWPNLKAAYEVLLSQLSLSPTQEAKGAASTDDLEDFLLDEEFLVDEGASTSSSEDIDQQYQQILQEHAQSQPSEATSHQVKMLSNIIEDQKARLKAFEKGKNPDQAQEIELRKALVEAWMASERSLIEAELQMLEERKASAL